MASNPVQCNDEKCLLSANNTEVLSPSYIMRPVIIVELTNAKITLTKGSYGEFFKARIPALYSFLFTSLTNRNTVGKETGKEEQLWTNSQQYFPGLSICNCM